MNEAIASNLIHCAIRRARIYGGLSVDLEKKADALALRAGHAPVDVTGMNELQAEAFRKACQAHDARRRYFRELATADLLGGHSSPFSELG